MNQQERFLHLDTLRAFAALWVCLHHFQGFTRWQQGWVSKSMEQGFLGVHIFFVLSGFLLPWSMHQAGFHLKDLQTFFLRRWIRLYPTFFVAWSLSWGLWWLSWRFFPSFRGDTPFLSMQTWLTNLTLSTVWAAQKRILPVAWTLEIEFQFYLLIALCFPFFFHRSTKLRILALLFWIALPFWIGPGGGVFFWTGMFALGILCALYRAGITKKVEFCCLFVLALFALWWTRGTASALVCGLALLFILCGQKLTHPLLSTMGAMSYAFYLIHYPISKRVLQGLQRYMGLPVELSFALAFACSLGCAWCLYRWIEAPTHRRARRLTSCHAPPPDLAQG